MSQKITIAKTLITKTEDLKVGDVIYINEHRQRKLNAARNGTMSECNFRRLTVVRAVRQDSDGVWRFDTQEHNRLTSTDGAHMVVEALLNADIILTNGSFGANHIIDAHRDTYRLDTVRNIPMAVYSMPNLKGNPAYDLMM